MKSRASLIALGIGAYLAFAIATFPASVAYRWFAPDSVVLTAVEGTVWRGSAAYGAIDGLGFSDLRWQLRPAALVTGRASLAAEARLTGGLLRSDIVATPSRITLSNLAAGVNLSTLRGRLPPELEGITGHVNLQFDRLEIAGGWPVAAAGTVRVSGLSAPPLVPVRGVQTIPLGNYIARLTMADDTNIVAAVNDEGGPLQLEGRVSLTPERAYQLEARITPRPEAIDPLVEGLKFMDPDSDGSRYVIRYQGRL